MTTQVRVTSICRSVAIPLLALMMSGCATSQEELLPVGDTTMKEIWQQHAGHSTGEQRLLDVRSGLRRPLATAGMVDEQLRYSRDAGNEIYSQFRRLPNPDLVMYVFPHLAGSEQVPVPGYSTVFPFYQRTQYAMPGEAARPSVTMEQGRVR